MGKRSLICGLCDRHVKRHHKLGGVIRVDSRFQRFSNLKRTLKFKKEKLMTIWTTDEDDNNDTLGG